MSSDPTSTPPQGTSEASADPGGSNPLAVVARALSERAAEQRELADTVAALQASLADLGGHLAALDDRVQATALGGEERDAALGDRMRAVEEGLLDLQGAREQIRSQLRELGERLTTVGATLSEVRQTLVRHDRAASELLQTAQEQLLAEAQRIADTQRGMSGQVEATAEQLRTVLDLTAARQDEGLSALTDAAGRLDSTSRDAAESLRTAAEAVGADLSARMDETTRAVDEGTARLRDELTAALEDALAQARQLIESFGPTVQASAEEVRTTFEQSAQTEHGRLAEAVDGVRAATDQATATLTAFTDHLEAARAEDEARTARAQDAAAELQSAIRADVDAALRELRQEVDGVLGGVEQRIADAVQRATEEARAVAAEEAGRVRDELAAAVARLSDTAQQVAASNAAVDELRSDLVDYLRARDQALERDRMQLLIDLLDELAEEMPRKDARRLANQAAEARDRARDRRDADRFRDLAARDLLRYLPGAPQPPGSLPEQHGGPGAEG